MNDLDSRIEAAARAMEPDLFVATPGHSDAECVDCRTAREEMRLRARAVLEAAFGELFTDPPSAWLAPVEPTEAMIAATKQIVTHSHDWTMDGNEPTTADQGIADEVWEAMRLAHLSPKHEEQDG